LDGTKPRILEDAIEAPGVNSLLVKVLLLFFIKESCLASQFSWRQSFTIFWKTFYFQ